ncbi:MAG TPA: hypothetical protein VNE39_14535 [Planctomycetota bacterium]|nr:hypothetical protein [Planctomycetota bacterium]
MGRRHPSRRDLRTVHPIRSEFERRGNNPLLFLLTCRDDESAE